MGMSWPDFGAARLWDRRDILCLSRCRKESMLPSENHAMSRGSLHRPIRGPISRRTDSFCKIEAPKHDVLLPISEAAILATAVCRHDLGRTLLLLPSDASLRYTPEQIPRDPCRAGRWARGAADGVLE